MTIEVCNETGYPGVNEEMLADVAGFALRAMDVNPQAETAIYLVDEASIAELHVRWLDLEGPTDVMSFPMDGPLPSATGGRPDVELPGSAMLGDIVLCPAFAKRQADVAGHDLGHELALLTVHGCLHLLGYDHATAAEEREMFALQNELLADWYDSVQARGVHYQEKPTGPGAFPNAAERAQLDQSVPGGGVPPIAEPAEAPDPEAGGQ